MSEAEKMFKELGYKEIKWAKDFKDEIVYKKIYTATKYALNVLLKK